MLPPRNQPRSSSNVIAAAMVMMACTCAHAKEIALETRLPPAQTRIGAYKIDYFDLRPGMTPQEAEEALKAKFKTPKLATKKAMLSAAANGAVMTSEHYRSELVFDQEQNSESVHLQAIFTAGPSGNQMIGLSQRISYGLKFDAPTTQQAILSIGAQFGEPSQADVMGDTLVLNWTFKDGKMIRCDFSNPCPVPDVDYVQERFQNYLPSDKADYIIAAEFVRRSDDPQMLSNFRLKILDVKKRAQAAEADKAALAQLASAMEKANPSQQAKNP